MKKWKLADLKQSNGTGNFEALFTIDNEDNGRSYVLYTDNTFSEEGSLNVYASFFDAEKGTEELYDGGNSGRSRKRSGRRNRRGRSG